MENWKTIEIGEAIDLKIFSAKWVRRENPKTGNKSNFVILDSKDWVNIIPLTKDNKIVLVQQYRHGIDEITLEIPGGLIDQGETPLQAAKRECIEETGFYSEDNPIFLGKVRPNPAFLTNTCYTYLWKNVEKKFEPKFDQNEEVEIIIKDIKELYYMIRDGKIHHSIVLNAFLFFFLYTKEFNIWEKL
ncbi:MAG: NUDIX hydrolase [Ignavibacteria bacterium]|nr:NUDIX hydrolase [Ignavibacteria bacterium]